MEHLPHPQNPYQPIVCKHLEGDDYGSLDFFRYPTEAGVDINLVSSGDFGNDLTPRQVEAFLQSWLFFGLIKQVLNPSIQQSEFLRADSTNSRAYLCTVSLHDHISKWKASYDSLPTSEQTAKRDSVCSVLREASRVLNSIVTTTELFLTQKFMGPGECILGPEHELILRVLVQTLEFELFPDFLPRQRVIADCGTKVCQILLHRLASTGWCPNQIDMLAHTMDVPSLYYVTLLGRPLPDKDHSLCSTSMCSANIQIDDDGYETKHVESGCTCAFVSPDVEEVANLVAAGAIPLILVIDSDKDSPLRLDVKKAGGYLYIALSHVWSDGLGNAMANALPICQLRLLSKIVSTIQQPAFFWIDTLCVPVKPVELRNAAIQHMRETYESAYAVLVIDGGVNMISSLVSNEELYVRIACSGWVRRLWTYQEMILAKELYIVLADGTVNLEREKSILLYTRNPETGAMSASSYSSSIALEASAFLRTLRSGSLEGLDRKGPCLAIDFGSVWEGVQWRSTSRMSDEAIVLATVMDVDVGLILDLPAERRMQKILSMSYRFPPYMIFAPIPRIPVPGYRWAPPSLMIPGSMDASKLHHMNTLGSWHPEGLLVSFPGFVLNVRDSFPDTSHSTSLPMEYSMMIHMKDVKTGVWYFAIRVFESWLSDEERWESTTFKDLTHPAVILSCPVSQLSLMNNGAETQHWDGVIVNMKRIEDDIIFTDFVSRVSVGMLRSGMWADAEVDLVIARKELAKGFGSKDVISFAVCETKPSEQRWCVG